MFLRICSSTDSERVALRDAGPLAGAHQSGAPAGRAVGSTGSALGSGESSTMVGSSSLMDLGLNLV